MAQRRLYSWQDFLLIAQCHYRERNKCFEKEITEYIKIDDDFKDINFESANFKIKENSSCPKNRSYSIPHK